MINCKSGDIAVITWDEEPVFSNIGKLVRVEGPPGRDQQLGLTWFITPINYPDGYLFIDGWSNFAVKIWEPGDKEVGHPDAWLRPIENPDDTFEGVEEKVIIEAAHTHAKEMVTES